MAELKVRRNRAMRAGGGVEKMLGLWREKTEERLNSSIIRKLKEEERGDNDTGTGGQVVLYTTTVKAVRKTHEACKQAEQVLRGHQVALRVKDVFLHPDYSKELSERMENRRDISLPQLFVAGDYIGNGQVILEMNESGDLTVLLQHYKRDLSSTAVAGTCPLCGGQGFVLCSWCKGSKKGIENAFKILRCTVCNQNGLQMCPHCT